MITIFAKTSFVLRQNWEYFCWIFWRKYFKNHNIVPRSTCSGRKSSEIDSQDTITRSFHEHQNTV
jgi:hypothetical protein